MPSVKDPVSPNGCPVGAVGSSEQCRERATEILKEIGNNCKRRITSGSSMNTPKGNRFRVGQQE